MTLIFSHVSPITGLFALSDSVVSMPDRFKPRPIAVPFRGNSISHTSRGFAIAGLSQKMIIAEQTMLMWANSQIAARALCRHILDVSDGGRKPIENPNLLFETSGLAPGEIAQTSLIYHYNPGPQSDRILFGSLNCEKLMENGAADLVGTGSGVDFFFNALRFDDHRGGAHERVLRAFISKIMAHAIYEYEGNASLDHLYGGWFEIGHRTGNSFEKLPYAIKRWWRQDGRLASGPTLFGWYSGNNLIITRQDHPDGPDSLRHIVIPDFLGRDSKLLPPACAIRPKFIVHIVHEQDQRTHVTHVAGDPDPREMIIEARPDGFTISWTQKLERRLLALGSAEQYPVLGDPRKHARN